MKKIIILFTLITSSLLYAQIPTNGLVAYYPFNGNANDESGSGRSGVPYNVFKSIDRFNQPDKAAGFKEGMNSYIEIPNTQTLHLNTSGFSLCVWINTTEGTKSKAIVGKHISGYGNGYYLSFRPSTTFEFYVDSESGLRTSKTYNDGNWHFVVGTFDGAVMKLYVDGVFVNQQNKTYTSTNNANLMIGKFTLGVSPDYFVGLMDDIRIYNRAITASEVTEIFHENNYIPAASITVTSPNGGENWQVGSSQTIGWISSTVSNVVIEYSTNNGSSWNGIVAAYPAVLSKYNWTVPNAASTQCKVRITDASNSNVKDESNSTFTISNSTPPPPITTTGEWTHYSAANYIQNLVTEGDYVWIASQSGGAVKFNQLTGEKFFYTVASTKGGLPSDNVTSIAIDQSGNKWFTCWEGGLAKFDGTNWTTWKPNSGLPIDWRLNYVTVDSYSNKWIIGAGELVKFDGATWKSYNTSNSLIPSNTIYCVAVDPGNVLWIGTDNGLAKFDGTTWTKWNTSNSQLTSNHIYRIAVESNGTKWIGTFHSWLDSGEGIFKFDGTTWTRYTSATAGLPSMGIKSIAIDKNGNKWFAFHEDGAIGKFNGSTWTFYKRNNSSIPHNSGLCVASDKYGNIWEGGMFNHWGGDPCLVKFDGVAFTKNYIGLSSPRILSITFESNGTKWFSTEDGLSKLNGYTWTNYSTVNSSLPSNGVLDVVIDNGGVKWIPTTGGLAKFDGVNWTIYNTQNSKIPYGNIKALAIDQSNNKWIGFQSGDVGIVKFDGTNWTQYNYANSSMVRNPVNKIIIDNYGNKWICTDGGGLVKFDGSSWSVFSSANSQLPSNVVTCAAIDANNNKWIGTFYGGLVKYDGSNWTKWNTSNGMKQNDINDIAIDNQGNKWFGYYWYGAGKFDGNNFIGLSPNECQIPHINVGVVEIDGSGNKWFGTHGAGVAVYSGSGVTGIEDDDQIKKPTSFILSQNYPNPFNPSTTIKYTIPFVETQHAASQLVTLKVFDVLGKEVATLVNEEKAPGNYEIRFNVETLHATSLPSGVYFYTLKAGHFVQTKKMIFMK